MTEAKSPREIAEAPKLDQQQMLAVCKHVASLRSLGGRGARAAADAIEALSVAFASSLSYAAERERLLADADEVIVAAYGEIPEHGIGDNRRRLITEAFKRFRLSSRPATEGKREDD